MIERHAFDPFGLPLASDGTDAGGRLHDGEFEARTTPRGFTGHEHLDAHRLIHMGGRVFDPRLGRFLSVDPFIQNLASSQSLNPYSYVLNNPFAGTDPTGFSCQPIGNNDMRCLDSQTGTVSVQPIPTITANGRQAQGITARLAGPAVATDALERGAIAVAGAFGRAAGFAWGVLKGFFSGGLDTAAGLYHVVAHPVMTAESLAYAARHPRQTARAVWHGVATLASDIAAGNPDALGRGIFEAGTLAFGAVKVGKAARVTDTLAAAGRGAGRGGPKLLPEVTRSGQLTQAGLEHIVARHWATSGARGAGKFAEGTTARGLRAMIDKTIEQGVVRANTRGRPGYIFEHDFGRAIGTDMRGEAAMRLRVVRMPDGTIKTAFPF